MGLNDVDDVDDIVDLNNTYITSNDEHIIISN